MNASNMSGKAVVVTGAASGLGRATAIKLAQAGADVCIVDLNPAGLEETATQMRALGGRVLMHVADLSLRDNCPAAIAAAVAEFGRLDALCNVAGIIIMCNAHEMSARVAYEKTLAINLHAPFYLMQAAIPHLLESSRRGGQCHFFVRWLDWRGLCRRLLRQQGRPDPDDQGPGDGIRATSRSASTRSRRAA